MNVEFYTLFPITFTITFDVFTSTCCMDSRGVFRLISTWYIWWFITEIRSVHPALCTAGTTTTPTGGLLKGSPTTLPCLTAQVTNTSQLVDGGMTTLSSIRESELCFPLCTLSAITRSQLGICCNTFVPIITSASPFRTSTPQFLTLTPSTSMSHSMKPQ